MHPGGGSTLHGPLATAQEAYLGRDWLEVSEREDEQHSRVGESHLSRHSSHVFFLLRSKVCCQLEYRGLSTRFATRS